MLMLVLWLLLLACVPAAEIEEPKSGTGC